VKKTRRERKTIMSRSLMKRYKESRFYSWWTRYKGSPYLCKVLPIVLLMAVIVWIDQVRPLVLFPPELVHRLFYLPIVLSGLLFGFKGGFFSALAVTLLFLPHWLPIPFPAIGHKASFDEVVLFYAFGILIGLLVDRERLEAQLRRDQEHVILLGEAAATVAHELKNPVVTIGAYLKRMIQNTPPEDPNRERLALIHRECQRIEGLLQDMIHFARPIQPDFASADLNQLILEALRVIQPRAEQHQVSLSSNLDGGLSAVWVDRNRLTQVLQNLILNAVQASKPGQEVLIATSRERGRVLIQVADQGCGIPPDHREKVFAPFFSTKREGSGLGLAFCKRIVEMHRGKLYFKTNRPQGTVFCVSLPLSRRGLGQRT